MRTSFVAASLLLFGALTAIEAKGSTTLSLTAAAVFAVTAALSIWTAIVTRNLPGNRSAVAWGVSVLLVFYAAAWAVRPLMDTAEWSDWVTPFSLMSGAWFCAGDRIRDLIDLHRWRQITGSHDGVD